MYGRQEPPRTVYIFSSESGKQQQNDSRTPCTDFARIFGVIRVLFCDFEVDYVAGEGARPAVSF